MENRFGPGAVVFSHAAADVDQHLRIGKAGHGARRPARQLVQKKHPSQAAARLIIDLLPARFPSR